MQLVLDRNGSKIDNDICIVMVQTALRRGEEISTNVVWGELECCIVNPNTLSFNWEQRKVNVNVGIHIDLSVQILAGMGTP